MNSEPLILLAIALVAANLPFMTERRLFVLPSRGKPKAFLWRLVEWALCYGVTGLLAWFVESRSAPPQAQHWEFYVTTLCLFLVFAYPGYVLRYLFKRKQGELRSS